MNLLERGRISAYQFFAVLVLVRLVPVVVICPTVALVNNPATAWANDVIGSLIAIPLVWLIVHLGLKYPDKTIIGYTKELLGPIGGILVGSLILWLYFMIAASVLRTLGEAMVTSLMVETPILVFLASAAFLVANSVRNGMEINSRLTGIMVPVAVFLLLVVIAASYNLMDPGYLRPIFFAQGLGELIWPSASVLSFYTEFLVIGMLLPHINVNDPRQVLPLSIGAIFTSMFILVIHCLSMASVFGPLLNSLTLPTFSIARLVRLGVIFEHIESLITIVWLFAGGIKVSLFLRTTAVGLAQLLDLKDYRPLVYPLGALMVAVSVFSYENLIEVISVLTGSMIVFSISFLILILLVLYIALGKKDFFGKGTSNAGQG